MNKKHTIRLLSLAVALLMACAMLIACDQTSSNNPPVETQPPVTDFELTEDWVVIRSDTSEDAMAAIRYLRKAIKDLFGFEPALKTDFLAKDQAPAPYEILVGPTNRENAAFFYEGLTLNDYGYYVVSGGTIAITGGSSESMLLGAERFMSDMFGYKGEGTGEKKIINVGASRLVKYTYPVTSFTVSGNSIADYSIVHDSENQYKSAAKKLQTLIADMCGVTLPLVKSRDDIATKYYFFVGNGEKNLGQYIYQFNEDKGNVSICAAKTGINNAVTNFINTYLPSNAKGKVNLKVPAGINSNYTFTKEQFNDLKYQKTTDQSKVCAGVTRYTRHYVDRNGKPVIAYVIEAAPGSVNPIMGTRNSEYSITTGTQSILNQISAETNKTRVDICAAVNGCYYIWDAPTPDGKNNGIRPRGLNVKDGKVLCTNERDTIPVFAVLKNGNFFFGYPSEQNVRLANIQHCIGGFGMVLKDGEVSDLAVPAARPEEFSNIRHPRTVVAAKADGTLVLIVVDGRQPSHSNGASLADMAVICLELDCVDAVNIDGGGSSISYTKNYATGQYTMWNKPSDGSPRSVINSLLLCRNPFYKEK